MLEWGDLRLAQSVSIARFVARQAKLTGEDAVEDAKIDMIVDHVTDHFRGKSTSSSVL